jgi:hypothetical protein
LCSSVATDTNGDVMLSLTEVDNIPSEREIDSDSTSILPNGSHKSGDMASLLFKPRLSVDMPNRWATGFCMQFKVS